MRRTPSKRRHTSAALVLTALAGCASTPPPEQQHDLCAIFDQRPEWYDHAKAAEARWGTPVHILMAFIRFESNFRQEARPERQYLLGIIPWGRASSAYGYAQIKDPAWQAYQQDRDGMFHSRTDMADVLDFIGWYNARTARELGISKWNPKDLYLAYHEGRTGYREGTWRDKPDLVRTAERLDHRAREYGAQLRRCEDRFRCDGVLEFWPLCSA